MIGAVDWDAWDEASLRRQIERHPLVEDKARASAERPFRLACIQLATYDGTIYNVRKVLEQIGHLCDYVLWDEAWIGYNAFHPLFEDHSPMRIDTLDAEMPGLFSTQSVHKQGAGFSQASQIHKRDEHIRDQRRYVEHKRFNESLLMHVSTSPFYPLFASLDVNAKIHEGKAGEMLWDRCIELGIEARKKLREFTRYYESSGAGPQEQWFFDPFVPDVVTISAQTYRGCCRVPLGGAPDGGHQTGTAVLALPSRGFMAWIFRLPDGYAMVDPNKLTLLTPGIDRATGEYRDFGIPATMVANYLREQRIVPEVRPQQHTVSAHTCRGREQAQHADSQVGEVQELMGSGRTFGRGSTNRVCGEQRALCRIHTPAGLRRDARLLSASRGQGIAAPLLQGGEHARARNDAESGL